MKADRPTTYAVATFFPLPFTGPEVFFLLFDSPHNTFLSTPFIAWEKNVV